MCGGGGGGGGGGLCVGGGGGSVCVWGGGGVCRGGDYQCRINKKTASQGPDRPGRKLSIAFQETALYKGLRGCKTLHHQNQDTPSSLSSYSTGNWVCVGHQTQMKSTQKI